MRCTADTGAESQRLAYDTFEVRECVQLIRGRHVGWACAQLCTERPLDRGVTRKREKRPGDGRAVWNKGPQQGDQKNGIRS